MGRLRSGLHQNNRMACNPICLGCNDKPGLVGTFQQLEGANAAMQHNGDGRAEVFGSLSVL